MRIAQKHLDKLSYIKTHVRHAHDYFRENYDRFNKFVKFIFESSLTPDETTMLQSMNRPQLQFNILESRVSRLLGEMSKQEPDIMVMADDELKADPITIKVVEAHLRHTLLDIENEHMRYMVYKDVLAGGFGVIKVYTDYANPMSMDQIIKFERAEPTLCIFDVNTKLAHKGDGKFCAQLFPKTKDEFMDEFPDINLNTVSFRRDFAGFNWTYQSAGQDIVLVCDYYEKIFKETTIVSVSDQQSEVPKVMTRDKYNKMLEEWNDITVPPIIIGKPRRTMLESIDRYRVIDTQVIEHEHTDYTMLPLIFVDGNSVIVKTNDNGNVHQVTRPYCYNAKSAQRMKNFAGISMMNEVENATQAKLMVAKEALPKEEEFKDAYKNPQQANIYVFNSVHESDPAQPIQNPIREVQKIPAPPEIMQAFQGSDSLVEQILGSYDAALGINNNQLSGVAIVEGATQSNSAAMPYVVGFMQGLQRAAQVYVDLLPKYYVTPRTLPIIDDKGKRQFVKINTQDGMPFDFDTNALNVVVKAGASFQVQKSRTIMMVKEMMGMSQEFGQFISQKGMRFVLDNMEGRGIEQLKDMVEAWEKEQEQLKQQQQQMQQMQMQQQQQQIQQNPQLMKVQVEMQKLEHEKQKDAAQHILDMQKLKLEREKIAADKIISHEQAKVQLVKAQTERHVHDEEVALKKHDMSHRHLKEALEHHHHTHRESQHDHHRR